MDWTIGADPEVLLSCGGVPVSVIGKIGGSKDNPRPVEAGAIQEDNVAAEFNITPCNDRGTFVMRVRSVMQQLHSICNENIPGCEFIRHSSAEFPESELEHPAAKESGCEPDYCVYTKGRNCRPQLEGTNLRSAGGHIHIGIDIQGREHGELIVRALDIFLALPAMLVDKDTKRRVLYGKAGCYRPKSYGIEYRTLSNFWIFQDSTCDWAYRSVEAALCAVNEQPDLIMQCSDAVAKIIDTDDSLAAEGFIFTSPFHLEVPNLCDCGGDCVECNCC